MTFSSSLTTLVSEFVALQKSPDARISTQSAQDIRRAVAEEKRSYSLRVKNSGVVPRSRCTSVILQSEAAHEVAMRNGPRRQRPNSFIGMIRSRLYSTTDEPVPEEETTEEPPVEKKHSTLTISIS